MNRRSFPLALLASGALHAVFAITALIPERALARPTPPTTASSRDHWTGDTFDVELLEAEDAEKPKPATASLTPRPREPAIEPPAKPSPPPRVPNPPTTDPSPAPPAEPPPTPPTPQATHSPTPTSPPQLPPRTPAPASSPIAGNTPPTHATGDEDDSTSPPSTTQPPARGSGFGAAGDGGNVRQLGRAFTRALPAAALPKDGWLTARVGTSAEVRVTLRLEESGHLEDDRWTEVSPKSLRSLLRRVHLLLQRGRFSIGSEAGPSAQTFIITVQIEDRDPSEDPFAEPGHIMQRGFEPPEPNHPGRAYFTFASGRHVVLHVALDVTETPR